MKDHRLPHHECPSCEMALDAATDAYGEATPEPGDLTVCIYCAAILVFTDTMGLRLPTDEEFAALPQETRQSVERLVQTINAHGPGVRP